MQYQAKEWNNVKTKVFVILMIACLLFLSACGSSSGSTSSGNSTNGGLSSTAPANQPSENTPTTGSSTTEDSLKTITAETAEAQGICGKDLIWYYQNNVLVIPGTGEMTNYEDSHKWDYPSNAPWGDEDSNLFEKTHWIVMEDGITSIGEYAFSGFKNLVKIEPPDTLERIEKYAFEDCYQLSELALPSSLSYIGECAFLECSQISEIVIPASVKYIDNQAFRHTEFDSITFIGDAPEGVENILNYWYGTAYYSSSTFDSLVEEYSGINWIKK